MHERVELAASADPHELAIAVQAPFRAACFWQDGRRAILSKVALDMAIDHVARHLRR